MTPGGVLSAVIALAAIIVLGRLLARLFALVGQPPVIGEVVAGILLGPSLLGAERSALVLSPAAAPLLSFIATVGVVLYMFIVGLELDFVDLTRRARVSLTTAAGSIVVPFVAGALVAMPLFDWLGPADVQRPVFMLFMGAAMSITAFPVLARILTDLGLSKTDLGVLALSSAALADAAAWCLLAVVVGVAQARPGAGLTVTIGASLFAAVMFGVVGPVMTKVTAAGQLSMGPVMFVVLSVLALSAFSADAIGIHAICGAFLFGAIVPHGSHVARAMTGKVERAVRVLLLPAFFALTGMHTRIDLLSGWTDWLICGGLIVVATLAKFGGTFLLARFAGLAPRQAALLGMLMNTRGLMELIVLNVGLDLGVIPPALHAMMVVMALVTTAMTAPLVRAFGRLPPAARGGGATNPALGRAGSV